MKTITQAKPKKKLSAFFDQFNDKELSTEISTVEKNHLRLVSSAFVRVHSRDSFKNNEEIREVKSEKLHEILNRFIENGITFEVSADGFQIIDCKQKLKTSDREFLEINSAMILCTLHQSLLVKHLFSHSPEQFEDFSCAIAEREAIMTGDGRESFSIHCEAVKDVSKNWFVRLLKDIPEQGLSDKNGSQSKGK